MTEGMRWVYNINEDEWYLVHKEKIKYYTGSAFAFGIPDREYLLTRYVKNGQEIKRLLDEQEQITIDLQTF